MISDMKRYEKIIFIYSIIAITGFFMTSALLSPSPLNLISGILILPIFFYFWLKFTNAEKVTLNLWSIRLLIVIILISALSIYAYFLSQLQIKKLNNNCEAHITSKNQELAERTSDFESCQKDKEILNKEIDSLKNNLTRFELEQALKGINISSESLSDVLATTDEEVVGKIKVNPENPNSVYVYQEPIASSSKVGELNKDSEYGYVLMQENWYKIILDNLLSGWVQGSDIFIVD